MKFKGADKKLKYKSAVALNYDGEGVPSVAASASSIPADEIVKIARRHGVAVVEKPELASLLSELEIDEEIPEHLFKLVALIINQIDNED